MNSLYSIFVKVQKLSLIGSQQFPLDVTKLMVKELGLKAASFYTVSGDKGCLILRGQYGLDYKRYISFELPLNTVAGVSYETGKIVFKDNVLSCSKYRDKELAEFYELEYMVAIPIFYMKNGGAERIGSICLYPKTPYDKEDIEKINLISESVSLSYSASVEKMKAIARDKVVSEISISADLNSALHRVVQTLPRMMGIESSSVFIFDEGQKLLRLHATTGIKTKENLAKHDIVYNRGDTETNTWKCFAETRVFSLFSPEDIHNNEKYLENTRLKKKSMLLIPITSLVHAVRPRKTKGVYRAINKLLIHEGKTELISFTAEDLEIFSFICEIFGLAIHMFIGRKNRISYFEKIMHGTKSNIQTSLQNLDLLERRGKISSVLSYDLQYAFYDTVEWLGDIKNQMDRLDMAHSGSLNITSLNLAGDVLINAVRLFEKSAQARGVNIAQITNLKESGFFKLPRVRADVRALMTVFRNLIENALKYMDYDSDRCTIDLSYRIIGGCVEVSFTDYGIGIPSSDKDDIFDEGFRSENAIRQDPTGTGLGLTQSKEIMLEMQGDLILRKSRPATFVVRIEVDKS